MVQRKKGKSSKSERVRETRHLVASADTTDSVAGTVHCFSSILCDCIMHQL